MASRRIQKEYRDGLERELNSHDGSKPDWAKMVVSYRMRVPGDMFHWILELDCPAARGVGADGGSLIEDLFYGVRVRIAVNYPNDYPFKPPRLRIDEDWLRQAQCEFGDRSWVPKDEERTRQNLLNEEQSALLYLYFQAVQKTRQMLEDAEGTARAQLLETEFVPNREHRQRRALEQEVEEAYLQLEKKSRRAKLAEEEPAAADEHMCSDPTPHVLVKTLTGKTIRVPTYESMSVEDLKEALRISEDMPVDRQRLYFSGKQLENGRTLKDYNIQRGMTIHLVYRLGGCTSCSMSPLAGEQWTPALTISKLIENMYHSDNGPFRARFASLHRPCWMSQLRNAFPPNMSDDELQWLLRAIHPSRQLWSMETDRLWPLTFRKVVLYLLKVRGSGQSTLGSHMNAARTIAEYL